MEGGAHGQGPLLPRGLLPDGLLLRKGRRRRCPLCRRALAEFVGSAFLLLGVIGSGIAASRLSHDSGEVLFLNAMATGLILSVVILAVGPVSGAHLNPLISIACRLLGQLSNRELAAYSSSQLGGAIVGTLAANLMFSLPAFEVSTKVRIGAGVWFGEVGGRPSIAGIQAPP